MTTAAATATDGDKEWLDVTVFLRCGLKARFRAVRPWVRGMASQFRCRPHPQRPSYATGDGELLLDLNEVVGWLAVPVGDE